MANGLRPANTNTNVLIIRIFIILAPAHLIQYLQKWISQQSTLDSEMSLSWFYNANKENH